MSNEPVTRLPDDRTLQLWRERVEPPLVTIRCGRGTSRCDRIAYIYETPGSAVVVFFQSTPDQPASVSVPEGLADLPMPDGFKKFDPEAGQALLNGLKDDRGTAVCLEDDAHWINIVEAGCRHHVGLVPLSRPDLMTLVRKARAGNRRIEVLVPTSKAQR